MVRKIQLWRWKLVEEALLQRTNILENRKRRHIESNIHMKPHLLLIMETEDAFLLNPPVRDLELLP